MKKINSLRLLVFCSLSAIFLSLPFAGFAAEKPIELKFGTSYSQHRDHEKATFMFIERVQKAVGNRMKFVNKGGPEAIPPFELGEAVRKGILDFANGTGGYYAAQIPEANAIRLTQRLPWELRANGALDLMKKRWVEKANFVPLGWFNMGGGNMYHFYSKTKIQKMADFKDLKIRSTPTYKDFILALGAIPIQMSHAEIYTSLERGVVQAVASPAYGIMEMGWQTQIKYTVFPGFFEIDMGIIFNWDSWKKIPADLQKVMEDTVIQVEKESHEFIRAVAKKQYEDLKKVGVEEITLEDAKKFLALGYEASWKDVLSKSDPKYGPELKKLLSK